MSDAQFCLLEEAKALLSRTRMGGKAVVALGLAPVHVRLAAPAEAKGALVLSDQDSAEVLAVRLAAIGLKLRSPHEADGAIRQQALAIGEDLATRLGGDAAGRLRETVTAADFVLAVPKVAAKKAKKLKPVAKPLRTRLGKLGFHYLGAFEVGEDGLAVIENTPVQVPARAGPWFAFATAAAASGGSIGALLACAADEAEGLEELVRDAKPVGALQVEGGTAAIVDEAWIDHGPLDKWTEEVEDPIAKDWGCRIGERGCQSTAGEGDGEYPVHAYVGRDGKARLVRVTFSGA